MSRSSKSWMPIHNKCLGKQNHQKFLSSNTLRSIWYCCITNDFSIEMSRIFMPENNYVALPTELQSLARVKMRLELMTHGLTRRSNWHDCIDNQIIFCKIKHRESMSTGIYPVGLEPTIAFMKRKCEFTNYSKEQLTTASIL